jgi:hypothetical protein
MGSASAAWEQSTILPSVPPDAINYTSLTSFRCSWDVDIFNTAPGNGKHPEKPSCFIPAFNKCGKWQLNCLAFNKLDIFRQESQQQHVQHTDMVEGF